LKTEAKSTNIKKETTLLKKVARQTIKSKTKQFTMTSGSGILMPWKNWLLLKID
jgi:hypothetical protein